jgi:hypothetical protein
MITSRLKLADLAALHLAGQALMELDEKMNTGDHAGKDAMKRAIKNVGEILDHIKEMTEDLHPGQKIDDNDISSEINMGSERGLFLNPKQLSICLAAITAMIDAGKDTKKDSPGWDDVHEGHLRDMEEVQKIISLGLSIPKVVLDELSKFDPEAIKKRVDKLAGNEWPEELSEDNR